MGLLLAPSLASAAVKINEIMYDLEGADSGREWVEIFNDSDTEVNLTNWKFNDGSNHLLNEPPKNGGQGSLVVPAGGYAIFAGDATVFLSEHQSFSGTVIDTAMSLNNTAATLKLIDNNGTEIFSISYNNTIGAAGDGNSLQYINGNWIAAAPTPGAANASVSELPPEQQSQQSQSQSSSSGSSSSSSSSSYTPPEKLPQIKAYAGEDKTVTVGANVEFRGQAFGLKDEPLTNARYLWVFGDGASKEGKNITHVYQYPGEYIVSLNVSSGEYSASDYLLIKAVPNQVFISEIKTGANGWIELENKSKEEIDISGCQIKYNDQNFIFPQSTRMRPGAYLVIPSSVSGIIFYDGKGIVELLYAGGFKADIFNYDGFLSENESFNRIDTGSLISLATPGAKNSTPTLSRVEASTSSIDNSAPLAKAPEEIRASKSTDQKSQNQDNTQTANMITVGDNGAKSNTTIYLIAIIGVILFASAAILFIRRHRGI